MTFDAYSKYYDLLYRDKDYATESEYIENMVRRFDRNATTILELGCGTGKHARLLADRDWQVTGVEVSQSMLQLALTRTVVKQTPHGGFFEAIPGDARFVRIDRTFDAVVSLFHVVSYQTTNADVENMFSTASHHLNSGGVFIFDLWYGPAVLHEHPVVRVKRMENEEINVLRIAEPTLNTLTNTVNVHYTMLCTDKQNGELVTLTENHLMRYFFMPELSLFTEKAGLSVVASEEWLTGKSPSSHTWGVTIIAQKL
jgi:SAM-dependent methyltransferase